MVAANNNPTMTDVLMRLFNEYSVKTPQKLKLIDAYLG